MLDVSQLFPWRVVGIGAMIFSGFGAMAQNVPDNNAAPALPAPPAPILDGHRADPDIRVFGDTYYIYPTSDKPNWNTTDFSCWSSKDLIHWTNDGVILDVAHNLSWAKIRAWAPTAETRNGKYYFYFVADSRIGVATADSPTGPFTDALGHPLIGLHDTPFPTYPIDPDVFIDTDGQAYLYYGNNHLAVVKLNADMISLDGAPVEITPKDAVNPFREGIYVIKRKGLYYFMWSVDDARSDNYHVAYGIAHSPLGPIEIPPDNVILRKHGLAKGTGHHAVVNVPGTDRWYIVYHRHAIPNGNGYTREVCLNRMEFTDDGRIMPVDPLAPTFPPDSPGESIVNGKGSELDPVPADSAR
jgi:beta-xylosidase